MTYFVVVAVLVFMYGLFYMLDRLTEAVYALRNEVEAVRREIWEWP
jgi:hypothetical protein